MAAVATGVAMDIPFEVLKDGIESLKGVSGRLEKVENQKGIHIFVDYAHTPDALERSLLGLRSILEEMRQARPQTGGEDHHGFWMWRRPGSNEAAPDGRGGRRIERSRHPHLGQSKDRGSPGHSR